jgi:hypothetical protein
VNLVRKFRSVLLVAAVAMAGALVGQPAFAAKSGAPVESTPHKSAEFNGGVYALAYRGSTIYVGGDFTTAYYGGKSFTRNRLAAVDANSGALLNWKPSADGAVRGIAADTDGVYAVGDFGHVSGQKRDGLVGLNPDSGAVSGLSHNISGVPKAVAIGNGRVYVAGRITMVDGAVRGNLFAVSPTSGAVDTDWKASTDDTVEALAISGNRVYLAGSFHKTDGVSSSGRLTAVDPASGALDKGFRPQPPAVVHAVAVDANGVYTAVGGQGGRTITYGLDGRERWTVTTDGDVQAVTVLGGVVYIGGHYDNVCQSVRTGVHGICIDGSVKRVKLAAVASNGDLLDWAPNGNGIHGVFALVASEPLGEIAAGGEFTTIKGAQQRRFALFGF